MTDTMPNPDTRTVVTEEDTTAAREWLDAAVAAGLIKRQHVPDIPLIALLSRHRIAAEARVSAREVGLANALRECGAQFEFYAREHTAAGKHEKAATNQRYADIARAALNTDGAGS